VGKRHTLRSLLGDLSAPVRWLGGTALGVWAIKHLVSPLDRSIYRLTGGRHVSTGRPLAPMLLLTTTGRRTGFWPFCSGSTRRIWTAWAGS
jgi:hypothetical protein